MDRRGLSKQALIEARKEMLDHQDFVEMETTHPLFLPITRFKRKMDVSDVDWDASQPRATIGFARSPDDQRPSGKHK